MKKTLKKPLAVALGAGFLASAALPVMAGSNPFTANPLGSGYDLVSKANAEGKCGEGKCGEGKKAECAGECEDMKKCEAEGKCGEGKCGDEKKCEHDKPRLEEAKPAAAAEKSASEGKCGEGMCGSM